MGGARSHVLPIQLSETAGALRAQHGAAEKAQGGVLPLVVAGLGTPEERRAVSQRAEGASAGGKVYSGPLTGNDWLDLAECCNPPGDQSDGSVSSGICS